jgi:hypothetical protein
VEVDLRNSVVNAGEQLFKKKKRKWLTLGAETEYEGDGDRQYSSKNLVTIFVSKKLIK